MQISVMTSLEVLQISSTSLSGSFPSTLGALRQLKVIDASNNILSGSIPNSISCLSNLEELILNNNHFSGAPVGIKSLKNLNVLHIDDNSFTGPIAAVIDLDRNIQQRLSVVGISNNIFSGHLPFSVPFFGSSLLLLDASGNCIQGSNI